MPPFRVVDESTLIPPRFQALDTPRTHPHGTGSGPGVPASYPAPMQRFGSNRSDGIGRVWGGSRRWVTLSGLQARVAE